MITKSLDTTRQFELKEIVSVKGRGLGYITVINYLTSQIGVHFEDGSVDLFSVDVCEKLKQDSF